MKELIENNIRSIVYGQRTINFSLLHCNRKTMEIAVHPDRSVIVKAPLHYDIALIEKKIIKRSRWILKQINYFKQFDPKTPDRYYLNGETHLYLGKQYRLRVAEGQENSIKLSQRYFHIRYQNDSDPHAVKKLLNKWYLEKARIQFAESLDRCWQKFNILVSTLDRACSNSLDRHKPKLSIKRMKKRWGSLSERGTVTLNADLIRAPKECIDYVIMHELCHLKYHDHSPEFYKLLDRVYPEWEKTKHKLELSLL